MTIKQYGGVFGRNPTFTTNTEEVGFDPELMWYRVGVKTGEFTSGTVVLRLGREDKDRH